MADIFPSPNPTETVTVSDPSTTRRLSPLYGTVTATGNTVTLSDATVTGRLSPLRATIAATANTVTLSDAMASDTPDLVTYDTGALAAGRYEIHWTATGGAAASRSSLVRRNAANTADVLPRARLYTPANTSRHVVLRVTIEANERFKVMGKVFGGLTVERLWD